MQRRISLSIWNNGVFLESLEYFPAPFSIDRIIGDTEHQKKTLDSFWALQIVGIRRLDDEVFLPSVFIVAASWPRLAWRLGARFQ